MSIALFPDVIKSALQTFHVKLNTILNGEKVKKIKFSDSLKRKVLIDFFKLFNKATFLISVGSSFQGTASAAAKE